MASVRYSVSGVPERYAHAFTPMPGLTPAASGWGDTRIYGSPGTTKVPTVGAGRPGVTRGCYGVDSNYNASGTLSLSPEYVPPSSTAPDWFAPQVWFTDIRNRGPLASAGGVHYMPGRAAPVPPAIRPEGGVPGVAMRGPKISKVMKWPRVITRWRSSA